MEWPRGNAGPFIHAKWRRELTGGRHAPRGSGFSRELLSVRAQAEAMEAALAPWKSVATRAAAASASLVRHCPLEASNLAFGMEPPAARDGLPVQGPRGFQGPRAGANRRGA